MPDAPSDPSGLPDPPPGTARANGDRETGDFLGPLLRTLAESLDVREIFARISDAARRIVPHDFLMFGLLSEDGESVRVTALSADMAEIPGDVVALPQPLRLAIEQGAFLLSDLKVEAGGRTITGLLRLAGSAEARPFEHEAQPFLRDLIVERGLRSHCRVAVRLRGGVLGGLVFCSTARDAYSLADLARAAQIADCVALAVAHQRLAEEEQRSAEARERASRLELRVRRLTEELDERGRHRILGRSRRWQDVLSQATKVAPDRHGQLVAHRLRPARTGCREPPPPGRKRA